MIITIILEIKTNLKIEIINLKMIIEEEIEIEMHIIIEIGTGVEMINIKIEKKIFMVEITMINTKMTTMIKEKMINMVSIENIVVVKAIVKKENIIETEIK